MKIQHGDRVQVKGANVKRRGEVGRVIEIDDWTAVVRFDDRGTKLYGLRDLTVVESPAPVVG